MAPRLLKQLQEDDMLVRQTIATSKGREPKAYALSQSNIKQENATTKPETGTGGEAVARVDDETNSPSPSSMSDGAGEAKIDRRAASVSPPTRSPSPSPPGDHHTSSDKESTARHMSDMSKGSLSS